MMVLTNLVTSLSPNFGSGKTSRFLTSPLRGILLRFLRSVFGPTLPPFLYADRIERSTNDVITNSRKIFNAASPDQYNRVLLQVMTHPWDVGRHFNPVGESNTGHFAQRRVRLLRRRSIYARANASLLWTTLQCRRGVLALLFLSALANQLTNRRHKSI